MAWNTVVMMNGPPLAPVTSSGRRSRSRTMVGVMAESMRLPGAMALASPCTRPYMFGVPGRAAKSSISLFSRNPAPATVTADPYQPLIVVVSATALPRSSVTEKCVVCRLSAGAGLPEISREGVARSVEIEARSRALNAGDRISARSNFT